MRVLRSKTFRACAVIAAGAIAAAVQLGSAEHSEPARTVAPSPAQPAQLPTAHTLRELLANAGRAPLPPKRGVDVFAARQPTAVPVLAAPAPIATKAALPVFPYKYAGWLRDDVGSPTFFLERDNRIFAIKVGDVLDGFRIDAIGEERLEVTFLAGGQRSSVLVSPSGDGPQALAGASGGSIER
jgi:hypothetical protein